MPPDVGPIAPYGTYRYKYVPNRWILIDSIYIVVYINIFNVNVTACQLRPFKSLSTALASDLQHCIGVAVHRRLVQCLGKLFGGVAPVFGLALHRGIQVKFQRSLGEVLGFGRKGNFAGGSQQRQNKSVHVAGGNINLRLMFILYIRHFFETDSEFFWTLIFLVVLVVV